MYLRKRLFGFNIEETNFLIQMGLIKTLAFTPKKLIAVFLNFPKIQGTVAAINKPKMDIAHEFIPFVQPLDTLSQAENLLDISSSIIFWDESFDKVDQTFEYLKNYYPLELYPIV